MIPRRRVLATGSAFLAWPATGAGQDTGKVYHVASLGGRLVSGFHEAFAQQLMELGWRPGQNVRIEYRWYEGKLDPHRPWCSSGLTSWWWSGHSSRSQGAT